MRLFRRKPKLPPYQYKLRFPAAPRPIAKNLPHLVFYDGAWHLYRSRWKSQWRKHPYQAACITAPTISALQARLAKAWDRFSFGYGLRAR